MKFKSLPMDRLAVALGYAVLQDQMRDQEKDAPRMTRPTSDLQLAAPESRQVRRARERANAKISRARAPEQEKEP